MKKTRRCHSRKASLKDKFDVSYAADVNTGCWLWIGTVVPKGYGQITHDKKTWLAHRLSWTLHNGEIPDGKLACHKCDTPSCVNPDHLFLGDYRDNINDCLDKGRYPVRSGETHPTAKLTYDDVAAIRQKLSKGASQRALAAEYGVTRFNIMHIKHGRTWVTERPK